MPPGNRSRTEVGATALAATGAPYEPNKPVAVEIRFDSPHVVTYHLWFAAAGGPWQKFASGTDEDVATLTGHRHVVGPFAEGTRIGYLALFVGNPQTAFRGQLTLSQDGQTIERGLVTFQGQTDGNGAAVVRGEVPL